MTATIIDTVLSSYIVHIYMTGFVIAFIWRIINIRNNNLNIVNDDHPVRYVDSDELDSIKDYNIDWLMLFVECSVGAFFAIFMASLLVVLGVINAKFKLTISFEMVASFISIPGYSLFIRSRDLFNKYVTSKISKSLWE